MATSESQHLPATKFLDLMGSSMFDLTLDYQPNLLVKGRQNVYEDLGLFGRSSAQTAIKTEVTLVRKK